MITYLSSENCKYCNNLRWLRYDQNNFSFFSQMLKDFGEIHFFPILAINRSNKMKEWK